MYLSASAQACTGPDVGLLVGVILLVLGMFWCVYCLVARENEAKKMDSFAFLCVLGSQFVSLFQMLGVLQSLSVAWPEPFASIVELGSLMNFRLEVLNLGCVVSTTPLHLYVANAFGFVVLIICMTVCHHVHIMVFHFAEFRRWHFRRFTPSLFGAFGTVFSAVYISVCSAIVQPLQCDLHPNRLSTMRAYRQVICWDLEGDHRRMMIVGALASLAPLAFLSLCTWVVFSLPKRLHQGDTAFLNAFAFLLFRFRPGTLRAGVAPSELRLVSGARHHGLGIRSVCCCHVGYGLHPHQCVDIALDRAPGEPFGRRNAHRTRISSSLGL